MEGGGLRSFCAGQILQCCVQVSPLLEDLADQAGEVPGDQCMTVLYPPSDDQVGMDSELTGGHC